MVPELPLGPTPSTGLYFKCHGRILGFKMCDFPLVKLFNILKKPKDVKIKYDRRRVNCFIQTSRL